MCEQKIYVYQMLLLQFFIKIDAQLKEYFYLQSCMFMIVLIF